MNAQDEARLERLFQVACAAIEAGASIVTIEIQVDYAKHISKSSVVRERFPLDPKGIEVQT